MHNAPALCGMLKTEIIVASYTDRNIVPTVFIFGKLTSTGPSIEIVMGCDIHSGGLINDSRQHPYKF